MTEQYNGHTWENLPAETTPINSTRLGEMDTGIVNADRMARRSPAKRVKAATTAAITRTGVQTVDDVDLFIDDRVLVKDQPSPSSNGIYVVSATNWERAEDADVDTPLAGGMMVSVDRGTENGGKVFRLSTPGPIIMDTTPLTFVNTGEVADVYTTDGTTPLKYSTFLQAAGGNHNAAFQNALLALTAKEDPSTQPAYSRYLDLEGARVELDAEVEFPAAELDHICSVYNGEIFANPGFSDTHLMTDVVGPVSPGSLQWRFVNVTFNGNNEASWCKWENGNLTFLSCHLYYPHLDGANNPGLKAENTATFYIRQCRFWSGDAQAADPRTRTRVAVHAVGDNSGDQKISSSVFAHFLHAVIYDAFVLLMTDCHIYQGSQGEDTTPGYTAGIKFTRATFGSAIANLYLDKCFIELSNEYRVANAATVDDVPDSIGGIHIIGVKTLSVVEDPDFAFIQIRDYREGIPDPVPDADKLKVQNLIITGCQFSHNHATNAKVRATALHKPLRFDRQAYDSIYMSGNTFGGVDPQSNPCTIKKDFDIQQNHYMDFSGFLPFAGYPRECLSVVGDPTSGGDQVLRVGTGGTLDDINIETLSGWAGTLTVTATTNNPDPANGANFRFINT